MRSSTTIQSQSGEMLLRLTEPQKTQDEIFLRPIPAEEEAENYNRRENHHLRPSRPPITCVAAPLLNSRIPIIEGAPGRRRVVWVWVCCVCGYGGMKISVDPCPNCCNPRCPNCDTRRINTRSHQ
ncbi:hypothetical protein LB507_004502 [Fusarium sp. FIESC RH6]|nr:hypothetical protein LB507_004502 [Fusarium sp. FIESC RH6]